MDDKYKKMADPELILAQMISFLEKVESTIRERTNIGSSKEHAELPGAIDARRATPSITDHQPDTGASTTTPPPVPRAAPNAPDLNTDIKSLNDEPDLKGGFAVGRKGQEIDQIDINQDMNAMTDDGEI